jgi:hypothetical protein
MGRIRDAILKVLETGDYSVKEICKKVRNMTGLKVTQSQTYMELYLLEGRGEVTRKSWQGCWIWSKVK